MGTEIFNVLHKTKRTRAAHFTGIGRIGKINRRGRASRIASVPEVGDPFDVEAFGTVDLASADNAADVYASAARLYRTGSFSAEDFNLDAVQEKGWPEASMTLRKWLDDNTAAMAEWRRGSELSEFVSVQPKDLTITTDLEFVRRLRDFSRLTSLQTARCLHEGDVREAWAWQRAVLRTSRHCTQHCSLIVRLIGAAIHASSFKDIERWAADSQVDESLLAQALRDVIELDVMTGANSVALKSEYLWQMKLYDDPVLMAQYWSDVMGTSPKVSRPVLFLVGEPEYSRRLTRMLFHRWLREADVPSWSRLSTTTSPLTFKTPAGEEITYSVAELDRRLIGPPSSLARVVPPAIKSFEQALQREAVRRAALQQMLASQLEFRRHGDWPSKPESLVPDILSELIADPFGKAGETLLWRRDGDDLLIYSVGENGIDDGGDILNAPLDQGVRLKPPKKKSNHLSQEKP